MTNKQTTRLMRATMTGALLIMSIAAAQPAFAEGGSGPGRRSDQPKTVVTSAPKPSETPEASKTPRATETAVPGIPPSETPDPSKTPKPSRTPEPHETPEITATPPVTPSVAGDDHGRKVGRPDGSVDGGRRVGPVQGEDQHGRRVGPPDGSVDGGRRVGSRAGDKPQDVLDARDRNPRSAREHGPAIGATHGESGDDQEVDAEHAADDGGVDADASGDDHGSDASDGDDAHGSGTDESDDTTLASKLLRVISAGLAG